MERTVKDNTVFTIWCGMNQDSLVWLASCRKSLLHNLPVPVNFEIPGKPALSAAENGPYCLICALEVNDGSTPKQRCGITLDPIHLNSDGSSFQFLFGSGGNFLTVGQSIELTEALHISESSTFLHCAP